MRQAPKRGNYKGVRYELRSPATSFPTTMQLGVSRLSDEEGMRRRQLQLCFYCGEAGHRSVGCPHKSKNAQRVTIEHFSLLNNKSFLLPVTVNTEDICLELTAMIDSGAALNLISKSIVKEYNLPTQPCIPPIQIKAIDNTLIGEGITHQTQTLTMTVGLFHQESISLYVVNSPKHEIILGHPCYQYTTLTSPDIMVSFVNGPCSA